MKQNKKNKAIGAECFDEYYSELYGERWALLKQSLFAQNVYVKYQQENCTEYFLDPASVCAALSLDVSGAEKILDLCAAPGGKTLVLSSFADENSQLFSNERSAERKNRLSKVVQTCLPESISSRINVTCSDGALWCQKETEAYDSILLDAPCSSERHVLNDEKYLKDWTPSRIKTLSMEQWALLSSAWRLLKKGGTLVYSTCALAESENDGVIRRLLKKFNDVEILDQNSIQEIFNKNLDKAKNVFDDISLVQNCFSKSERTEFGNHILPDASEGAGPIFYTVLKKRAC